MIFTCLSHREIHFPVGFVGLLKQSHLSDYSLAFSTRFTSNIVFWRETQVIRSMKQYCTNFSVLLESSWSYRVDFPTRMRLYFDARKPARPGCFRRDSGSWSFVSNTKRKRKQMALDVRMRLVSQRHCGEFVRQDFVLLL